MKKIRLIPIEIEDEFDSCEIDVDPQEGLHFEFDLTPYVIACAVACGILLAVRFVKKRFF